MKSLTSSFSLLGHDCPYGSYPAPVIPIGTLDGVLVAVYPGGDPGPTVEPLDSDDDCDFVHHDEVLQRKLVDFDYRLHRLFAFSKNDVCSYPASQEGQFLREFLRRREYVDVNPSLRRALVRHVNELAERQSQTATL